MVYDGQSLISSYSLLLAEIVGAIDCTSVRHADCTTARHADCTMKSPLGCATLLPVKILQKFGDGKMFLKSDQIFTGKSVAQPNGLCVIRIQIELKYNLLIAHKTSASSFFFENAVPICLVPYMFAHVLYTPRHLRCM